MKENLTHFIQGLRQGNRMSQLINLRRNSSTLPLRRSLILLSALILSVGQMWGAYYYRGNQNGWSATQMTASADGFYEYFAAKGYTNNGNKNNNFKVSTTEDSWDYNNAYDNPGFNKTDITDAGDWDSDNMCVYNDVDFYILVYKPSTTVNATDKPIVCYASYLPDNRSCAIYFVNSSDWTGTLKAYGWFYDGTNGRNATWPGATMTNTTKTNNGHAIWSYTFTNSYPIVIFNNGSSQTSDITMGYSANGKMYNNGSWVALAYDVELNQQSGSGGSTSIIATCGSAMPGSKTAPTREGYTFGGYYTSTGGSGTKYYNANMTSAATWPADGSGPTTLYAKWTKTTYSVTINNDGHGSTTPSGAQGSVAQIDGIAISASADDDYEFFNWTIESGTGSFYDATSESTTFYPTSEATIQANFRSTITNSLMVTAGAHVGTVTGSTDPVTLGSKYDISATPETGYAFSSWTASPAANATFDDATSASTKVQVNNGSVTVTANAEEIMRTITIDGGTVYGGVATSTTAGIDTKGKVTANAPAAGKKFTGWSLGDGVSLAGGYSLTDQTIEINATANATVTATYADRGSVKMYFAKPIGWSKVYAYAWKGSDDAVKNAVWPGLELETTETIDCVDYYIYQYYTEADGIGGDADGNSEWTKVVFNDNNDARKTGNLNIADGHYYYKSSATNTSGSTTTIEHIWYLKGTMNSPSTWSDTDPLTHSCASHSGEITVVLTEGTSYQFKIYDAVSDSWWSNSTALGESKPITGTMASSQTLYSNDSYDMYITASKTAEYRFVVTNTNTTTPQIQVFFPDTYLAGDFNSWSTSANPFENGVVSVHLTAGDHLFKVVSSGTWYGNDGTIAESVGSWTFTTSGGDCKLTVATEGDYLFGWNGISHHVSVIFPEEQAKMKFNSGQYIYFDTRRLGNTGDGWNAAELTARFWVKNYATGEDVANSTQTKALTLEDGVYYTRLPENENIGQIQINRLNPENTSEIWCTANKVFAFERANANQNCLQEETGKESWCNEWTPQWTTYCPPVRSVSLTDNGTIEHTLYGGDGTKDSPFLIKTGEHIEVMGSAVSAVSDANMTAYYQFKKDDANVGEASSTNTASITASSVSGTKEKITVEAYNVFNSASGTSATSAAIYYEVRTPYTISYNKGSGDGISGSHVNMRKLKGVNHHLPFEVFTRTGYRQTGWTTSDGGSKTHELGGYYTGDADQTFYPVWTANPYTITLNNYGGEGGSSSVTATYGQSTRFSILNPTREGYTFCGWYYGQLTVVIDTEGNLIRGVNGFTNAEGQWTGTSNCTLKAIWKHNSSLGKYNFRYGWHNDYYANEWNDVNFGEATDDHMRTANFTIPTVSDYYYVGYDGEYCSKGINGASGSSTQSGLNGLGLYPGIYGSITPSSTGAVGRLIIWDNSSSNNLGVRFQPSGYGLTYASGKQAFSKADDHLWQTATVTLSSADVAGTFKVGLATATEGTYVDCNLSKSDDASALNGRKDKLVSEQSYPAIPNMASGQKGRFVIWDDSGDQWYLSFLPVYSVTYDANGGTGDAPAAATEYRTNETPKVLGNTFTHEGYSFVGWNTAENGTGAGYDAGDYLAKIGANVTLYAQWDINSHAITYTAPSNGSYTIQVAEGEAVSTSTEADYGQTVTLSATSAPCYVFNGWVVTGATVADASALTTTFTMPNADVTIEASFAQDNLALNKTVVAGYEPGNADEHSEKLTDGNTGTAWTTYSDRPASEEWFYVDLGAYYQLSSVELVWGDVYSTDYIIQARQFAPANSEEAADDYMWYPLAEETGATASATKSTVVNGPARYIRFHSKTRSGGFLRLFEFRVYGTGVASTYNTTPTFTTAEVNSYPSGNRTVELHLVASDSKSEAIHTYKVTDESGNVSIITTDNSNLVTINGLSWNERHTLTIEAMDQGAQLSESKQVEVLIWDPTDNLALNKTVVAGYEPENAGEHSEKLTDGNTGTAWTTYSDRPASEEWFYVDLGAYYQLSSVELVWGDVYSTDYIIQARQFAPVNSEEAADDYMWYPLAEETGATASATKSTVVNGPARYIRFHSKTRAGGFLRLFEFRVYGTGFATPDATIPEIETATASYNNDGKAYLTLTATDTEDGTTNWFRIYNPQTDTWSLEQTDGSNQLVIDGLEDCTAYEFKVRAMDKSAQLSAETTIDVRVPVVTGTNLALGKTTEAGTTEGGFGSHLAVDGDTGTEWSGNSNEKEGGVNQWLKVDLGKNYSINEIRISWGANSGTWPRDYELQSSYDGVNYRTFIHRTAADGERNNTYSALSVHGRYIRVWANVYGDPYGMCITEIEVYGECYDGEADDEPNDFTGGGATNAWTDLSNWPKGVLPGETDEVHLLAPMVIPDGTTVKIAKLVIATGGKQAGGMAEATGHLTIAPTAALIVSGEIKRCSDASAPATQTATTAADITIQSSAAGNGALVFTNGTGVEANAATVEMYSKATTEGADWTWQYIAAPAAVSALSNYYGGYLYKWNSGWEAVGNNDNMELFAGYCVSYPSAGHTFTIEGALAPTTEQSITVPAGKSMVIGNSWTAPIQISQMTAGDFTNVDQTVYLYNTGNDERGTAGTDEGDRYAAGTYVPVPINETATVGVTKVSSLQGFFVKNNSGSAGTLSLSYSQHVIPTGENSAINGPMHAPKRVADETERPAVLRMKVSGSRYDDRLILLEREDFTTGYDAGHDGEKIGESSVAPWLYTSREDGTADAVAALPDLEGTLINFRAGEDEIYTFGFEYEAEDAEPLYLLDLTNNAYTRVETGGSYTFVTTDKADHKRFALTRYRAPQIVTGVEDTLEDNVRSTKAVKFIENDKLYILLNGVLYDGTGKRAK